MHKYLYAHANPVMHIDPSGHAINIVGSITALTTAEGLQAQKAGAETLVQWEMRDMKRQLLNDYSPKDRRHKLGKEGEEVWEQYLNSIDGFRAVRAKGATTAVGPDIYGYVVRNGKIVVFMGEVKASQSRLPGVGALKWNIMGGMRQMSASWMDKYASDFLRTLIDMGLQEVGKLSEFRGLIRQGKIEAYLLSAHKKRIGGKTWKLKGYRLLHAGPDEVLQDSGGLSEIITEQTVVKR